MSLDLYLDTADIAQWDALMPLGIFTGITTNPTLAQRAGLTYRDINWRDLANCAAGLGATELHGQVFGAPETYAPWAEMLLEAGQAAGIRTVVKVPLAEQAIRTVPDLKAKGCPILMTACYDAKQMYIAAGLGADYIAPYFGRMLEADLPAYDTMRDMLAIAQTSPSTRIMVASLRNIDQMVKLSDLGCDCFTLSPDLTRDLLRQDMTEAAVSAFERAAD